MFLGSSADIAIYGGGAGGGKTWALLLEPLRHSENSEFGAVFFRRNTTQIRNEGGLWDESKKIYGPMGAIPKETSLDWKFPSGAKISFRHLEYERTIYDWQGSQIALECFDELTHFSATQFWYMVSRNRSMSGVRPYIRATCNPDPDSWVREFIDWWIDKNTGYPIPERVGKLRWFVRVGDSIMWADHPSQLASYTMVDENGENIPIPPRSVTFIPALVTDNKALMRANPDYVASLMSLGTVQRERLMGGNWNIRSSDGMFKRGWFPVVDRMPRIRRSVRGWDLAATPDAKKDGTLTQAATAGVGIALGEDGYYYVFGSAVDRVGPNEVVNLITTTASQDGKDTLISLPQDPGQAGKAQVVFLVSKLAGYRVNYSTETGDKATRAMPFASQAEAGNVRLVRGPWNKAYLDELEAFPISPVKDQVDASSRAFSELVNEQNYRFELTL